MKVSVPEGDLPNSDTPRDEGTDDDPTVETFDTFFDRTEYFDIQGARWFLVVGIGEEGEVSNFVADSTTGQRTEFPSELTYILEDGDDLCYVGWSLPRPVAILDTDPDSDPYISTELQGWLDDRGLSNGVELDLTSVEKEALTDSGGAPCELDPADLPAGFDLHDAFLRDEEGVPVTAMKVGIKRTPLVDVTFNSTPTPPEDHWYNGVLQNPLTLRIADQGVTRETRDYPMAGFAYRLDRSGGTFPSGSASEFLERSEMASDSALAPGLYVLQGMFSISYGY